ncbi:hypothetical protein ACTHRK_17160 [Dietzia cercidiphylli]|uniref:hypothetical protein n=1 Tax=Dietzia TaxID=37914 RepID=UPI0011409E01|nr:hypothetical protein [Dietzia natronolimnaea]
MSPHPSDPVVANLIRHARVGASASPYPTRTRSIGEHSVRQHSVGSLIVETARADAGVSGEVAQARREVIAGELERRRMVEAADEARRRAEVDRAQAERDRDEAVDRARRQGGPDPDFLTLALIAAVTLEVSDTDLVGVLDAALTDTPDLSAADTAALAGDRRVGLSPDQLSDELTATGVSPSVVDGLVSPGVGTTAPAELIMQSESSAQQTLAPHTSTPTIEASPEVAEA